MVKFILGMILGANVSLIVMALLLAAKYGDCEK